MGSVDGGRSVRILHLSDIHFRAETAWNARPVLSALTDFIGNEVAEGRKPDLVAITGDIAWSGKQTEYKLARDWLDTLWPRLGGLNKDRLLLVPGNHDVDRAKTTGLVSSGQTAIITNGNQNTIAMLFQSKGERDLFLARHHQYAKFARQWFGKAQTPLGWHRSIEVNGARVHVAGLNSAWMSSKEREQGELLLGEWQVNETVLAPGARDADWRIALMHHPWTYFAEFDGGPARDRVHMQCDLVLRGHLHQARIERIVPPDPERGCLELAAGCIYESSTYPNAFQWIELLPGKRVRVDFRLWHQHRWIVDRNQPNCPGGVAEYRLAAEDEPSPPAIVVPQVSPLQGAGPPEAGPRPDTAVPAFKSAGEDVTAKPEYCVSYAWGDDASDEGRRREVIVNDLCDAARRRGALVVRDKATLDLGDQISNFMRRIGAADRVFIVLSDKYLKSPFCMYELWEVWRNSRLDDAEFRRRIRAWVLPDAKIWSAEDRVHCAIYWKQQHDKLQSLRDQHGDDVLGAAGSRDLLRMKKFYQNVTDILAAVADTLLPATFTTDDPHLRGKLERFAFDDEPPIAPLPPPPTVPPVELPGTPTIDAEPQDPPLADRLDPEAKRRFTKLMNEVRRQLAGSAVALEALEASSGMPSPATRPLPERAKALVRWFEAATFDQAKSALCDALQSLDPQDDPVAVQVVRKISRLLLPWLYVVSARIDAPWIEAYLGGDIVTLPAGLKTMAEIIVAGIQRREVLFDGGNWPTGQDHVVLPEGGIADVTEQALRDHLFDRFDVPREFERATETEKDKAIANELQRLRTNGRMPYLIVDDRPRREPEARQYADRVHRLTKKYKALGVVELDDTCRLRDQEMFFEIRDLVL